jgi:hypothetical protein
MFFTVLFINIESKLTFELTFYYYNYINIINLKFSLEFGIYFIIIIFEKKKNDNQNYNTKKIIIY